MKSPPSENKMKKKKLICFRCGEVIEGSNGLILYVRTLSHEDSHIYCQATGVKPAKVNPAVKRRNKCRSKKVVIRSKHPGIYNRLQDQEKEGRERIK